MRCTPLRLPRKGEPMSKELVITVLMFNPGEEPFVTILSNELPALQAAVDGLIECFPVGVDGVIGVCNEEGLNLNLPFNRPIPATRGAIFGTFFVAGDTGDEFRSLTADEISRVLNELT